MKYFLFVSLIALLLAGACTKGHFYEKETTFSAGYWTYRDTVDFVFDIQDTSVLYNLNLDFTHADTFPNQNIYVRLHTKFPDGIRLSKPYAFDFFDTKGAPIGQCSGHQCTLQSTLQQNAFFSKPGQYVLTVEQFTRRDSLPGVKSVGLTIDKTTEKRK